MHQGKFYLIAPLALLCAGNAQAKEPSPDTVDYPGSVWNSTGLQSPVEKGNVTTQTHVEQGIRFSLDEDTSIVPFVSGDLVLDTKGFEWNNEARAAVGVKLEQRVGDKGVVSLRGGYAVEHEFKNNTTNGEPFVQAEYWFGWKGKDKKFPGSSWGTVVYNLPSEPDNVIGVAYVEQGYKVWSNETWSLVPFVSASGAVDSKERDWNNYVRGSIGTRIVYNKCSCDVAVAYTHEKRFESNRSVGGLTVAARFWFGW